MTAAAAGRASKQIFEMNVVALLNSLLVYFPLHFCVSPLIPIWVNDCCYFNQLLYKPVFIITVTASHTAPLTGRVLLNKVCDTALAILFLKFLITL